MAFDPNDPRVQQLLQALRAQGGHGKPLFGSGQRVAGGGGGPRGLASYYRPGGPGINFNPLQAQMASGAPGLLGLASGIDSSPASSVAAGLPGSAGSPGAPAVDNGVAPPVAAPAWAPTGTTSGGAPDSSSPDPFTMQGAGTIAGNAAASVSGTGSTDPFTAAGAGSLAGAALSGIDPSSYQPGINPYSTRQALLRHMAFQDGRY